MIFGLIAVAFVVLLLVSYWKIYAKAGQPGWACIIPIYNVIVLLRIVKKPWWWLLLMLIPIVDIVLGIIMIHRLSRSYGHDVGFTLGLIFLGIIFVPILGLGASEYKALED